MAFEQYQKKMYEIKQLNSIGALLSWDMEVMMPHGSDRGFRADQSSLINGLSHEKFTSEDLEILIDSLLVDTSCNERQKLELIVSKRHLTKAKKLSKAFVEKEAKLTGEAYSIWEKAKTQSDFQAYKPALEKIVDLLKEKCELTGYQDHPYNALLDNYEEGMTVSQLDPLFSDVKVKLGTLIEKVMSKQGEKTNILTQSFDVGIQSKLVHKILDVLKVNQDIMRMDISSHPFCTSFHSSDVRITTRYNEFDLMSSIWSAIHESGHARYEMGLSQGMLGLPSSEAVSLGIHESQSRFWENNIARSRDFIDLIFPIIAEYFPKQMENVQPESVFREVNYIEPSLIRTESDELTYHYHIMIRYEIEKELISGNLKVADVRDYWNDMYKKYLKIDVPNDAQGILQDVHWSFGGLGYFPTYSLGSFYASQWYEEIHKSLDLSLITKSCDFEKINAWHSKNIHQFGSLYSSDELCKKATGKSLDFSCFESYISKKFHLS